MIASPLGDLWVVGPPCYKRQGRIAREVARAVARGTRGFIDRQEDCIDPLRMGFEDLESEFGCVLVLSQSDLEDEVCVLKGKSFPMLQNTNQGDCRWACWIGLG